MVASEVEDVAALNWAWFGFEAFMGSWRDTSSRCGTCPSECTSVKIASIFSHRGSCSVFRAHAPKNTRVSRSTQLFAGHLHPAALTNPTIQSRPDRTVADAPSRTDSLVDTKRITTWLARSQRRLDNP